MRAAMRSSISLAASSKHISVLERAGLVQRRVVGREHLCRLQVRPLSEADAWVRTTERFWTARLDALATVVEQRSASPDRRPS